MARVGIAQKPWLQLAFVLGEAVLTVISSGVLFILISRVAGPQVLGAYALAQAWLLVFQGLSGFGSAEYLMREVGAHGRAAAQQVFHAMLLALGTGILALGIMAVAVRVLGYSPYLVHVITIASVALIPISMNIASRAVFLALREMQLTFIALFVEVTVLMSVSCYLLFTGHGVIALMTSLVVSKLISTSLSLAMLYGFVLPGRPAFDRALLVRTARTVFTFGLGGVLGMLTLRISTIMASLYVSISAIGHLAAATKILELGLIIPNLFVQLLMSRVAYSFNVEGNRDPNRFASLYQAQFALVVPVAVGAWVFAVPIMDILFGPAFRDAAWLLRVLMILLLVETADNTMSVILKADHRQRQDVIRLAFNPLTNVVLNLILLPFLGTLGATISRVGGGLASSILRDRLIARKLVAMRWLRFSWKPLLISGAVGVLCSAMLDIEHPILPMLLFAAATAALLIVSSTISLAAVKDMMHAPTAPRAAQPSVPAPD